MFRNISQSKMRKCLTGKCQFLYFIILITLLLQFSNSKSKSASENSQTIPPRYQKFLANIEHFRVKEEIVKTLAAYDYSSQYVAVTTARIYEEGRTVHCHYFDKHRKRIPGTSRQSRFINSSTVLCPKQPTVHFDFLDLSFSARDLRRYSQPIPINRSPVEFKTDFAICVKLKVRPNWLEVIRFVEWHRSIGFTFFYLTAWNLDEYTRRILDDYTRLGLVHLTSLKTSENLEKNASIFRDFQLIQEQNCDLRARTHANWYTHLGVNDKVIRLTERISPSVTLEVEILPPIITLEKFTDEDEIQKVLTATSASSPESESILEPRKLINPHVRRSRTSPFPQFPPESLTSSITARATYIFKTRPLFCDEIDAEILSWCPVSVYHCEFRDAANEEAVMEKRKEIQKDYKGIVYTW